MEVELDKYRAACVGILDEATVCLVMGSVKAQPGTKLFVSVTITAGTLLLKVSAGPEFTGDEAPPDTNSSSNGFLIPVDSDLDKLYKHTTSYTFMPGDVDTIAFKDAGSVLLGNWKGKLKPEVADPFKGNGTWS